MNSNRCNIMQLGVRCSNMSSPGHSLCSVHKGHRINRTKPVYIVLGKPGNMCQYCDKIKVLLRDGVIQGDYYTVDNSKRHDMLSILFKMNVIPSDKCTFPLVWRNSLANYVGGTTDVENNINI